MKKSAYIAAKLPPPTERNLRNYWAKVDKRGTDECWPWLGAKDKDGYGRFGYDDANRRAHRIGLLIAGIDVPEGLVPDHTCKDRSCQNPAHMRIATQKANCTVNSVSPMARNAQKTHCPKGHPYAGANLAIKQVPPRIHKGKRFGQCTMRICLACYPHNWRFAVIPRGPPPLKSSASHRTAKGWATRRAREKNVLVRDCEEKR